jgi:REP-associated tyrosine transposase
MPQSLAKTYLHLVFSTKDRERVLNDAIRPDLHAYVGGVLHGLGCAPIEINSEPEHAHLLFLMSRTHSMAQIVEDLKTSSNKWLQSRDTRFDRFAWQRGYAAFSVSQSNTDDVRAYIRNQREHHKKITFQDELRTFLKRHDVEFDERYVWD